MSRRTPTFLLTLALLLVLAACGGGDDTASDEPAASEPAQQLPASRRRPPKPPQAEFELTLAHSYQDGQPQVDCGANIIRDEVEAADVGVNDRDLRRQPARS